MQQQQLIYSRDMHVDFLIFGQQQCSWQNLAVERKKIARGGDMTALHSRENFRLILCALQRAYFLCRTTHNGFRRMYAFTRLTSSSSLACLSACSGMEWWWYATAIAATLLLWYLRFHASASVAITAVAPRPKRAAHALALATPDEQAAYRRKFGAFAYDDDQWCLSTPSDVVIVLNSVLFESYLINREYWPAVYFAGTHMVDTSIGYIDPTTPAADLWARGRGDSKLAADHPDGCDAVDDSLSIVLNVLLHTGAAKRIFLSFVSYFKQMIALQRWKSARDLLMQIRPPFRDHPTLQIDGTPLMDVLRSHAPAAALAGDDFSYHVLDADIKQSVDAAGNTPSPLDERFRGVVAIADDMSDLTATQRRPTREDVKKQRAANNNSGGRGSAAVNSLILELLHDLSAQAFDTGGTRIFIWDAFNAWERGLTLDASIDASFQLHAKHLVAAKNRLGAVHARAWWIAISPALHELIGASNTAILPIIQSYLIFGSPLSPTSNTCRSDGVSQLRPYCGARSVTSETADS